MKKNILILTLILLSSITFAQIPDTLDCNTPERDTTEFQQLPWYDNNDYLENLLDSIGYPATGGGNRIIGPDRVRYHIPIKFWVYRNRSGIGGPTQRQLQTYIDNLNRFYNVINNTLLLSRVSFCVGFS